MVCRNVQWHHFILATGLQSLWVSLWYQPSGSWLWSATCQPVSGSSQESASPAATPRPPHNLPAWWQEQTDGKKREKRESVKVSCNEDVPHRWPIDVLCGINELRMINYPFTSLREQWYPSFILTCDKMDQDWSQYRSVTWTCESVVDGNSQCVQACEEYKVLGSELDISLTSCKHDNIYS